MASVALDTIAELYAAGEGRFEWEMGSLLPMEPTSDEHDESMLFLSSTMRFYAEETEAGRIKGDGFAERLDEKTVRVPDVAFFRKDNVGRIKPTHSEGGADLIVEIVSPDSRNRDRGKKFFDYERAGVEEYWIVDPERRRAEFYRLREGAYEPVLPDAEGKVHSSTLPGFFIRVEWLWIRPKLKGVLCELGVL